MPVLSNPKHERFAQELAKGKSQADAYQVAGYKPSEPNASRLTSNEKVQARVGELLERAAKRTEITVATITERLERIADKSEKLAESAGYSVARLAAMDVAKLHGLVKDKSENNSSLTIKHDLSGLTDEQLAQLETIFGSNTNARRGSGGDTAKGS